MQQAKKRKPQEKMQPRAIGSVPPVTREQTEKVRPHPIVIEKARKHLADTGKDVTFIGIIAVVMHFTEAMGGGMEPPSGEPMGWSMGPFDTFEEAFAKARTPHGTGTAVATITATEVTITVP